MQLYINKLFGKNEAKVVDVNKEKIDGATVQGFTITLMGTETKEDENEQTD